MQQRSSLHQFPIELTALTFYVIHQTRANPAHLDGMSHDVLEHLHPAHELKTIIFRREVHFARIKSTISANP
jgi:hypothetical protein